MHYLSTNMLAVGLVVQLQLTCFNKHVIFVGL